MRNIICILSFFFLSIAAFCTDGSSYKTETLAKTTQSWDGKELPAYTEGKPEITILKITIPPGATLPLHEHPVINAGYLLSGELTVVTENGEILHLKAGDAIVEVVNKWHYGKNEGTSPAEIVVFYAGTSGEPISIKKDNIK